MEPDQQQQPPAPKSRIAALRQLARIPRVSWRDLAVTLGPVLLISAAVIALAQHFVRPAPPRSMTISAGPEGSNFQAMAQKYQKVLARNGITLKILTSQGSQENLTRLADPDGDVDVGFVQSGVTIDADTSELVSLGSIFYAPLTMFYRAPQAIERLSQLQGKRIAIGHAGSGTRFIALALLKANEIEPGAVDKASATQLLDLEGEAATKALLAGQIDAVFLAGDSAAPATIRALLHAHGIRMFDFVQGEAYARRFRYLTKLDLPPGAFDLGDNLPPKPFTMLAPTVELIATSDLHPVLSDLLIDAAREVNGKPNLLQAPGEFPAPRAYEYPLSADAARYYKSGKSFAYRVLPFWLASLADRLLAVLVPVLVVLIPGLRFVPTLYGWRVRNRIYARYGELMGLERAALGPLTPEQRAELILRLDEIEKTVITIKIPGAYADQIYILRQHIQFVREQLAGAAPVPTPS